MQKETQVTAEISKARKQVHSLASLHNSRYHCVSQHTWSTLILGLHTACWFVNFRVFGFMMFRDCAGSCSLALAIHENCNSSVAL